MFGHSIVLRTICQVIMTVYRHIVVPDFNVNMQAITNILASRTALKELKLH